jgi:hypothetical protein
MTDISKIRNDMFDDIFNNKNDIHENLEKTIKIRCKSKFDSNRCQEIFKEFILCILYTFTLLHNKTGKSKAYNKWYNKVSKFIPNKFVPSVLKINATNIEDVYIFLYLMQDHSFGSFKYARLASLVWEYKLI